MVDHTLISEYFPNLTEEQISRYAKLFPVYKEWNDKINVISRKDIDELYIRHVLHSLAIARLADFRRVHSVLDIGTGGGFPGIPLAIMFPHTDFHLVDSIGKKIAVVKGVAEAVGIENVKAEQARAEQITGKYDVVTCRAVTQLSEFYGWIRKNLKPDSEVLCLKGGDLDEEIKAFKNQYPGKKVKTLNLYDTFPLPFFETKKLLIVR